LSFPSLFSPEKKRLSLTEPLLHSKFSSPFLFLLDRETDKLPIQGQVYFISIFTFPLNSSNENKMQSYLYGLHYNKSHHIRIPGFNSKSNKKTWSP